MRSALFALIALLAVPVYAEEPVKIVAIVNDQIISSLDLNERVHLIMATTGIPDSQETRARLIPQILRQLIDEKLQLQDAAANSITINDEKVKEGMAKIEKQNGKEPGTLERFIQERHISRSSFVDQIRAQSAWAETVMKKIRPRVKVSDQEIARFTAKRKAAPPTAIDKTLEVRIASILLPVDSPKSEASIHKAADKLAAEIRGGANFEAIASQFSSGAGAKSLAPFWVELSQLDPSLAAALAKTPKGGVTEPLKTESGYQLIKLFDTRQKAGSKPAEEAPAPAPAAPKMRAELAFKQIIISSNNKDKKDPQQTLVKAAKEIMQNPGQCVDKTIPNADSFKEMSVTLSFIRRVSTDLPDAIRSVFETLQVGHVSEPVITPNDVRIFMLCERIDLPPEATQSSGPSSDAIRQEIFSEKLELEAQKYMRNLKKEAFIEIRGF